MKLSWMRQYRGFVEALVFFGNVWSRAASTPGGIKSTAFISGVELQVLEYILENEELNQKMAVIAERLYIPQSSFSKLVKQLVEKGLLEKCKTENNNKDVLVKATEKGRQAYLSHVENAVSGKWGKMFDQLDQLPPETVEAMTKILNEFSNAIARMAIDNDNAD